MDMFEFDDNFVSVSWADYLVAGITGFTGRLGFIWGLGVLGAQDARKRGRNPYADHGNLSAGNYIRGGRM